MDKPTFFAVIIGSEILDGRRTDKHFEFLKSELGKRGWMLSGVFIIEDEIELMKTTYSMIRNIPNSVMFSLGGIGATPDDFTRNISSQIFTNGEMEINHEFRDRIIQRFGIKNSIHRVNMSNLPKNSELLYNNPVNQMNGFFLENRYFFVPGFPEMSHPMISEALDRFFPKNIEKIYSQGFIIETSENVLIDFMENLPKVINLSSLPKINKDENGNLLPSVDIQLKSVNKQILNDEAVKLINIISELQVKYKKY